MPLNPDPIARTSNKTFERGRQFVARVFGIVCLLAIVVTGVIRWRHRHQPLLLATSVLSQPAAELLYNPNRGALKSGSSVSLFWDPLQRQKAEPDTLFLLDAAAERRRGTDDGAFIAGNPHNAHDPWRVIDVIPGKYSPGIHCREKKQGYLWLPSDGLFSPGEFTIELWLRSDVPWSQLSKETPFQIGGDESESCNLRYYVDSGWFEFTFDHWQSPAGLSRNRLAFDGRAIPAGTWTNVAVTFKAGTLKLYVNGTLAASQSGVPVPAIWSDNAKRNGLCLGGAIGAGTQHLSLSDLRISRRARDPHTAVHVYAGSVLTVWPREPLDSTIQPNLLGGLHTLTTSKTEQLARGVLKLIRTDKFLTVTPIVAGSPDAAHPTRGVSGKYAYDWQVVDRTLDYLKSLGVTPYISVDGTPSILGGDVSPFYGEKLKTKRSYSSAFGARIPTDLHAYGTLVRDLVHHILQERHAKVARWGIWNEPNSQDFWKGDLEGYLDLYETCALAVRSEDPHAVVGGPEVSKYEPEWFEALIRRCAERRLPLDFVSWHFYSGSTAQLSRFRTQLAIWSAQYGLPRPPEPVIGEWCWQISNLPLAGLPPFRDRNYFINDWHAAYAAQALIEMQRCGVATAVYTNPVAERGAKGWNASGLMSGAGPWANWNVFRVWNSMAAQVLRSAYDGNPGITALASSDGHHRLTILIASRKYREARPEKLSIRLPGFSDSAKLKLWTIDHKHSNSFDGGPAHAELEQTAAPRLKSGQVSLELPPRSVFLLELAS